MFEKEAEESFMCKKVLYKWETDKRSYIDGFKDGAEFGYNKAKEEMQKNGLTLQSDMDKTIEQNIALKAQIEKMKCCGNCIHEINEDEIEVGTWKKDELTKLIKKRLNDNPEEMKNAYYAIGVCNAIFFIITGEEINIPVEY